MWLLCGVADVVWISCGGLGGLYGLVILGLSQWVLLVGIRYGFCGLVVTCGWFVALMICWGLLVFDCGFGLACCGYTVWWVCGVWMVFWWVWV